MILKAKRLNIAQRIQELSRKLRRWNYQYYTLDKPSVSDQQYDAAILELKTLETQYPDLMIENSPTQKVGGVIIDKFVKEKHSQKMLSLDNTFSFLGLQDFHRQVSKTLGWSKELAYVAELKIDGVSIALRYEEGHLVKAITRGDGLIGENVTHNVRTILSLPLQVPIQESFEVRGEIFLSKSEFLKLNQQGETFANPRNAAAGTLRQLNSEIASKRHLDLFVYDLIQPEQFELKSHYQILEWLKLQGFAVNPYSKLLNNIDAAAFFIESFLKKRETLNYQIDGLVFKLDDLQKRQDVGTTIKFPKWAIAYKFPEKTASTTLLDIFPTVGRTGRITYNAKLDTVLLAGTQVSSATLHNADYVRKIKANLQDQVLIKKAGDIIPKVIKVVCKNNQELWQEAQRCPSCQHTLQRFESEVDQYCINENCSGQLEAKIIHFVSKNALNISGLGIEIVRVFIEKKLLKSIIDLYYLKNFQSEILQFEGFQKTLVNKILQAIEDSKKSDFDRLIFGLGIRHVGAKTSKILVQQFYNHQLLLKATYEDLIKINDIGPKVAESIVKFFHQSDNRNLLEQFQKLGFTLEYSEKIESQIFSGKKFVITGTLTKPRSFFQSQITANGGSVTNAISQRTNYLLVGQDPGSKITKAKKLNITIIDEEQFTTLLATKEIYEK